MAAVLKTVDLNGFGGSNPSLSALCNQMANAARKCGIFAFTGLAVKRLRLKSQVRERKKRRSLIRHLIALGDRGKSHGASRG